MIPDAKMLAVAASEYTLARAALTECVAALEYPHGCQPKIPFWNPRSGDGLRALRNARAVLKPKDKTLKR